MARRKVRLGLNVDDRTSHLSGEALFCRRYGHKWEVKAMATRRFKELLSNGLQEDNRYCGNGCGSTWRQVWRLDDGQIVENERTYPKNGEYLLPPNSGRLHRNAARIALFAREHPEYV